MLSVTFVILSLLSSASGFVSPSSQPEATTMLHQSSSTATTEEQLFEPAKRDAHYGTNTAQYLVDLHDSKATFDFCGGMLFQLVLSEKLRTHLVDNGKDNQPVIFDKSKPRMHQIDNYEQSAAADNVRVFHGREIRKVPDAAGDMNFVLQLSLADGDDPEGWTPEELAGYDGWGHDSGRVWREGDRLEKEGFATFKNRFGSQAFALHHRFYLHMDGADRMWLSAEDGCEGTPARSSSRSGNMFSNLFG